MPPDEDAVQAATGWLEKARGDLEAARACIAATRVPPWVTGFHLQQSCEKCLKALLILSGIGPPRTHDLVSLHRMLTTAGGRHDLNPSVLKALVPFATDDRYPILSPKEATRDEVGSLIPSVASMVEKLEAALE